MLMLKLNTSPSGLFRPTVPLASAKPVAWLVGKGRQEFTALAAPLRAAGPPACAI